MKFKKIALVYKEGLEDIAKNLVKNLKIKGNIISLINHNSLEKSLLNKVDLVITLGGDGTFVEAANLIEDCFILGINSNPNSSEGALTSLNIEEIGLLEEILNKSFNVIERQRAIVRRNGILLKEYSLNEVYVGAASQFHSSRYTIKYKDHQEEQRSSGVIISTGTGSGAWHKSAGGNEFKYDEKKLSFVVREPYPGKRLYVPKILKGDLLPGEKITLESKRDFGGILAIGFKTYDFNKGDIVEVELSDKPLKTIRLK